MPTCSTRGNISGSLRRTLLTKEHAGSWYAEDLTRLKSLSFLEALRDMLLSAIVSMIANGFLIGAVVYHNTILRSELEISVSTKRQRRGRHLGSSRPVLPLTLCSLLQQWFPIPLRAITVCTCFPLVRGTGFPTRFQDAYYIIIFSILDC